MKEAYVALHLEVLVAFALAEAEALGVISHCARSEEGPDGGVAEGRHVYQR
jgi:hypothetical protein